MEMLFQWATARPGPSQRIPVTDWKSLPKRPKPGTADRSVVDGNAGYVNVVDLFGNHFHADRYAVEELNDGKDGVRVTVVNDGEHPGSPVRMARQIEFWPLAPDASLNGAINTRTRHTLFTDDPVLRRVHVKNMTIRPWSKYVPPNEALFRYGADMPDDQFAAHGAQQIKRGWREWTHGLDVTELDAAGQVSQQQPQGRYIMPDGTRTYYLNNVTQATLLHNANNELAFQTAPAGAFNLDSGNIGGNGTTIITGITSIGEPNNAAWPTGNYRAQWDVTLANTDVIFGVQNLGTAVGHFARVFDLLGTPMEETKQQIEASFALTGLHLATTGSVSWTANSVNDVFEVAYCAQRVAGHGNASMTLQIGELDDFVDGPWPAATGGGRRIFIT